MLPCWRNRVVFIVDVCFIIFAIDKIIYNVAMGLDDILLLNSKHYEKSDLFFYSLYFMVWMCSRVGRD